MTTPKPALRYEGCAYCTQLRHENAKHRLKHVAERDAMEEAFRARESFLERENDRLRAELAAAKRGSPMMRRPVLAARGARP